MGFPYSLDSVTGNRRAMLESHEIVKLQFQQGAKTNALQNIALVTSVFLCLRMKLAKRVLSSGHRADIIYVKFKYT